MAISVWGAALDLLDADAQKKTFASPVDVARVIEPGTVQTPALDLLDRKVAETVEKRGGRLILSMPPQEGKSIRLGRDTVLWLLAQNPDRRVALASYSAGRADELGRVLRNAISEHGDRLGLELATDSRAAAKFSLAGHKGGVRAVGTEGSLTGFPADVIVVDDPHKDLASASSPAEQRKVWAWWTTVVLTRITPSTPIIVLATRWHENDLIGQLLSSATAR